MDDEQTMTNTDPVNSEVVNVLETSSFLSDDSYMQDINQENIRFNLYMDYNSPNSPAQEPTISLENSPPCTPIPTRSYVAAPLLLGDKGGQDI